MKPGIYEISNKDYHAGPGLSCSLLKEFMRSPAHYKYRLENPMETTPAMAIGTAAHTAVLEPDKFDAEIAAAPEVDRRTKAGKAEYAAFLESSEGKTVIAAKDAENVRAMADAVRKHEAAANILESGFAELSVYADDPDYGFLWKVRPDWLTPGGAIADLKTCEDASHEGFQKQIGNFGYHVQAALYLKVLTWAAGKPHEHFFFIAVEKKPPYGVAVYQLDFRSMDAANLKIDRARESFAQCLEKDEWPGYSREILTTGAPRWAI